ncbi:hydroxyacylglutathione hydrolase C-terminal domain-containing protein, partial [Magnetococcales bacterium HHB-1]
FPAHEYTLDNLRFARTLEPDNQGLDDLFEEAANKIDQDQPTLPNTLAREKRYNPFLRCDEEAFVNHIGLKNSAPEQVLAYIRQKRNQF